MLELKITGLQETIASLNLAKSQLSPGRAFGRVIARITERLYRYAVRITAVDTGAWRDSHEREHDGVTGLITISPFATNPRTGIAVETYASIWEERDGRLAVYARTVEEDAPRAIYEGIQELERYIR